MKKYDKEYSTQYYPYWYDTENKISNFLLNNL